MITLDVPGIGTIKIEHLVADYTGTLSEDGRLCEGVKERLEKLARYLEIHILTADTFGTAEEELNGIKCRLHILGGDKEDIQKMKYVESLGPEGVVAIGNGNNDRKMLSTARIGIAVCLREGCSKDALEAADMLVTSSVDALDLLLNPKRLKATLRF
jgi:soluble P-type ATPase